MSEIDIQKPVAAILKRLGLEPSSVALLEFRGRRATATVFKFDESGRKYIDSDTNAVAVESLEFKVKV